MFCVDGTAWRLCPDCIHCGCVFHRRPLTFSWVSVSRSIAVTHNLFFIVILGIGSTRDGRSTATIHEAVAVHGNLLEHIRSSSPHCTCFLISTPFECWFLLAMRCVPFQIPTTYVFHPVRASRMFFSDVVDVGFRVYACMSFRCRLDVSVQGHLFFCGISRYETFSHHVISPYALWEFAWFFCLPSSLHLLLSHLSAILCMSIAVSWVYVFVDFLCFLDVYL